MEDVFRGGGAPSLPPDSGAPFGYRGARVDLFDERRLGSRRNLGAPQQARWVSLVSSHHSFFRFIPSFVLKKQVMMIVNSYVKPRVLSSRAPSSLTRRCSSYRASRFQAKASNSYYTVQVSECW